MSTAYRVEATTTNPAGFGAEETVHVYTDRSETAMHMAFDELTDKGYTVHALGDVYTLDDHGQWVKTFDHRTVSALVG